MRSGVDAQDVMAIVRQDRKLNIAPSYLKPGFAFGGSCLPKDLRALLHAGRMADVSIPMLNAVVTSNESQIRHGIERVLQTRARRVGVVGLAFKPATDDLRESPMVAVVEALIGKGFDVRVYDSNIVPSRLTGANRRYIDIEIPHIASLLCDSAGSARRSCTGPWSLDPQAMTRHVSSRRPALSRPSST
jgi:GDP-mannose 6-dehydrogenase